MTAQLIDKPRRPGHAPPSLPGNAGFLFVIASLRFSSSLPFLTRCFPSAPTFCTVSQFTLPLTLAPSPTHPTHAKMPRQFFIGGNFKMYELSSALPRSPLPP